MKHNTKNENPKQTYDKPRLRIIELTADEVLAVGCKTNVSGTAPIKAPPCSVHHCAKVGS